MDRQLEAQADRRLESGEFVGLLLKHERRLRAFLMSVLPSAADIDDLVQEVSLLAWEKLGEFRFGGIAADEEFVAWLCTMAKFKVLNHRRKRSRSRLVFSDELVERLAALQLEQASHLETRHAALMSCISKLQCDDREMLRRRYFSDEPVADIAVWMERSTDTVYKALNRVRAKLMRCVELTLQVEGRR